MHSEGSRPAKPPPVGELAPAWHTAALVALILLVAIAGTLLQRAGALPSGEAPRVTSPRIFSQYLPLLTVNAALSLYVCRLGRRKNALKILLGRPIASLPELCGDLVSAAALFAVIEFSAAYAQVADPGQNAAIAALLPSTVAERLTWILVAFSVGFSEEVVYRGYLQTQLSAFSRGSNMGITLQALLFGIAHAEQGLSAATRIAVYGVLFGILAHYRRRLLPGIVCHIALDLASGLRG